MPAAKLDLLIEQGSTWRHRMLVTTGPKDARVVMDLTGYTARMVIGTDEPIELNDENDGIVISGEEGQLDFFMSATDSIALSFERVPYQVEIESPDNADPPNEVTRITQGHVTLNLRVPRVTA